MAPSSNTHLPPPGSDSSLFGLGDKSIMAMDSSEMSGGGETAKDLPTLYDYLVDMFGERLSLRLTGHQGFKAATTLTKSTEHEDIDKESRTNTSVPRDGPLMRFLSREGFRSTKVQLPQKLPHPRQPQPLPPSFGGRPRWTFPVPRPTLPVHSNVLEKQRKSKKPPSRRQVTPLKGDSPSYKRGAAKSRNERVQPSDISSSWL